MSSLHVEIAGIEYGEIQRASLEVSETLGRPTTTSFTLDDMASSLATSGWLPATLADVRVWDTRESGDLFRGQLTNVRASVEGVRRVLAIEAESYDRLLDRTLVGTNLGQYQHATLTAIPYDQQDSSHTPWLITVDPPFWADPSASTGIALPATDDASVVAALFSTYWGGPALTWDIASHGSVDDGGAALSSDNPSVEGRTYFGLTTLRDAFDRTASLISRYLAFWIDADLTFHWQVLRGYTWTGAVALPTGSTRHTLVRMLPESRVVNPAPYAMIEGTAGSLTGLLTMERVDANAVDRVYVRAGTEGASGWATLPSGRSTGTAAYLSAPWITSGAAGGSEVNYAGAEFDPRTTFSLTMTGEWFGIHAGQSMTLYSATLGVNSAQTAVIQSCNIRTLADGQRVYNLQMGDASLRTLSAYARSRKPRQKQVIEDVAWPTTFGVDMGSRWTIVLDDVQPKPGQQQNVFAQYTDAAGAALAIQGLKIEWSLQTQHLDEAAVLVSGSSVTSTANAFYLATRYSFTGADGRAANMLTAKSTSTGDDLCVVIASLV